MLNYCCLCKEDPESATLILIHLTELVGNNLWHSLCSVEDILFSFHDTLLGMVDSFISISEDVERAQYENF